MHTNPKVIIVSQPFFPVPPVLDGAISFIIQDTISCLNNSSLKVISLWDNRMRGLNINKKKFLFIYRNSLTFRGLKKILIPIILPKLTYHIINTKHLDMMIALYLYVMIIRPKVLVVHTTRCEWVINIKNIFAKWNVTIVWYHHMSEDHIADDEHLTNFSMIDFHFFVSNYSKEIFVKNIIPFDKYINNKSYVIRNGIDTRKFSNKWQIRMKKRSELDIDDDKILILYVGKLTPRKGLHKFLDAYRLMPKDLRRETILLIVGAADYYKVDQTDYILEIKEKAQQIEARIIFTNYIPHEDIVDLYSASDLLVFPSVEEEGMPLSIIEAQSMGLPVIASNVGGISEVVVHGETGYIYDRNSEPREIIQYLKLLIEDPTLRARLGQEAVKNVRDNFNRERMSKDFWSVTSEILNGSR